MAGMFTFGELNMIRTLRCKNKNVPGVLGKLCTTIGAAGAYVGDIRTISLGRLHVVRDIDVLVEDEEHLKSLLKQIATIEETQVEDVRDEVLEAHENGKIEMKNMRPVISIADLRKVYTPGVANVCRAIMKDSLCALRYTSINKLVAIVTDGSRVLGLGNIGPVAAMPVMEGKAALLYQFTGLSGVPILLNCHAPDEIVEAVVSISPTFGAIQLEDISAPNCFYVEEKLIERLDKPVMHDDQHGTAVVTLAAVINACKLVDEDVFKLTIGQIGLGAAGQAISHMLMRFAQKPVLGADLNKDAVERFKKKGGLPSTIDEIMGRADLVISTTGVPGLIKPSQVRRGQIIFALTNPEPEIKPELALERGARFAADGKSVNNLLGYPGLLKGALDAGAKKFNHEMYLAASKAIASLAEGEELVPSPLKPSVHKTVAKAVAKAAMESGIATIELDEDYFIG